MKLAAFGVFALSALVSAADYKDVNRTVALNGNGSLEIVLPCIDSAAVDIGGDIAGIEGDRDVEVGNGRVIVFAVVGRDPTVQMACDQIVDGGVVFGIDLQVAPVVVEGGIEFARLLLGQAAAEQGDLQVVLGGAVFGIDLECVPIVVDRGIELEGASPRTG